MVEADHRYCPSCGSPTGPPGSAPADPAPRPGHEGGPVLLGRVVGPATEEGEVRSERSTLGLRLGGVGALVLVGLLAWGLFRQSDEQVAPDRPGDAEDGGTAQDGDDPDDGDRDGAAGGRPGPTSTPARTTTTGGPDPGPPEEGSPATGGTPTGPVLGEETGLTLVSVAAGGLHLLDLDTGVERQVDGVAGSPVGAIGSNLVLQRDSRVEVIDLAAPEPEPRPLVETGLPTSGWVQVVDVTVDRVWIGVESPDGDSRDLFAYDVDGRLRDQIDGSGLVAISPSAGIVNRLGGGIYRRTAEGYQRRSTGWLEATGDGLALVRECDDAMVCRSRYVDIAAWSDAGHPAPADVDDVPSAEIVGADRWLVRYEWRTEVARVFEIATGAETRAVSFSFGLGVAGPSVTVSGDGRWLVDAAPQSNRSVSVIVDLDRGTEWVLPVRLSPGRLTVLMASTALAPPGR
jgi:hypothetical protein